MPPEAEQESVTCAPGTAGFGDAEAFTLSGVTAPFFTVTLTLLTPVPLALSWTVQ